MVAPNPGCAQHPISRNSLNPTQGASGPFATGQGDELLGVVAALLTIG